MYIHMHISNSSGGFLNCLRCIFALVGSATNELILKSAESKYICVGVRMFVIELTWKKRIFV